MSDDAVGRGIRAGVRAWHARARSLEMIGGVSVQALMVQDTQEQDAIPAYITSNFLRLLGVRPALGREFTLDEERVGGSAVAMITYGLLHEATR